MKWYKHDPAAFLEGVIGLTPEERGAYITLIDLLYARTPRPVTDDLVISALHVRPQVWRRLKASLIAKGKVHDTAGTLMANRVETTVQTFANPSRLAAVLRGRRLKNQELRLVRNVLEKPEEE